MTIDELRERVAGSRRDDWQGLEGPVLLHTFFMVSGGGEPEHISHDAHHSRAVLRDDLDVGLAWGLTWEEDFTEPWTELFANKKAKGHFADLLWRGQPVIRERYVTVDGGRYKIPLPAQTYEEVLPEQHVLMPYTVTPWQHAVIGLVHSLSEGWDYAEGLRRARVTVED
jgi:hypothetical protein